MCLVSAASEGKLTSFDKLYQSLIHTSVVYFYLIRL